MKKLLVLMLTVLGALVSHAARGADFHFAWGQINGKGFAFSAKPDRFAPTCSQWMIDNRVRIADQVFVNHQWVDIPRGALAQEICAIIISHAKPIGGREELMTVEGWIDSIQRSYTFSGTTSEILADCAAFIRRYRVRSTHDLYVEGLSVPLPHELITDEICGEIASLAEKASVPYAYYLVSGTIRGHGFAWIGEHRAVVAQCVDFLRRNRVDAASHAVIFDEQHTIPRGIHGEYFCDYLVSQGRLIENLHRDMTASGKIRRKPYWFAGKPHKFIPSCIAWIQQQRISFVTSVEINGQTYTPTNRQNGPSICGYILDRAIEFKDNSAFVLSTGMVARQPFAWAGLAPDVSARCQDFVKKKAIVAVNRFIVNDREVELPTMVRGDEICAAIVRSSRLMEPPFIEYDLAGQLHRSSFWFSGITPKFIDQCASFVSSKGISNLNAVYVGHDLVELGKTYRGVDVCGKLIELAKGPPGRELMFVAGQMKGAGYAFAGWKTEVGNDCIRWLQLHRITSTEKFTLFDQLVKTPGEWIGEARICFELEQASARFHQYPAIPPFVLKVNGLEASFQGTLPEMMLDCQAFVTGKRIGVTKSIEVNGVTHDAPNDWRGLEICGMAIRLAQ